MPMKCLATDLAALFASSDFGEALGTVLFRGTVITGAIFDDEDIEAVMPDGVTEIVHQAVLTAPSAQFPGIVEKDPVTIGGINFKVRYWMDDGSGVIEIYLVRA